MALEGAVWPLRAAAGAAGGAGAAGTVARLARGDRPAGHPIGLAAHAMTLKSWRDCDDEMGSPTQRRQVAPP